ncbi:MAG: hypothetical protein DCC88_03415, partial [Spirobacillus cienkowskii]
KSDNESCARDIPIFLSYKTRKHEMKNILGGIIWILVTSSQSAPLNMQSGWFPSLQSRNPYFLIS